MTSDASNRQAGVRAINYGSDIYGAGVIGEHKGSGYGVWGFTPNGSGVVGEHTLVDGVGYGVHGSHAGGGAGVYGQSASGIGVLGTSSSVGMYGFGRYGVLGAASGGGGLAGYFVGNVLVTGTLTKGAGAFRIDHPLDPAHKYLQHSFVESPDMMDVYNGNVVTDGKGFATVKLPGYFQALNRSFRYQLTIVGRSFAQAIVWKEIAGNRFTIKTNQPNVKVSWQVTGIRHDAYANAHRIPVVVEKPAAEQGKYLHPELYGKPSSASVVPKIATKAIAQARR
jgi:hypothetical protein